MPFKPSNTLYKETLSEIEQVPVGNETGRSRNFGMLPKDVMERRDISGTAKVIVAAMAMQSHGTGFISISHQALAVLAGCSRTRVLACLKRLDEVGLIQKDGSPVKQVQPYELMHPKFRHGGGFSQGRSPEDLRKRSDVPMKVCPLCHAQRRGLMKIGWCRSCNSVKKMEKTARRVFKEEIGKTA